VLNLGLRLFENAFSKQRRGQNASERPFRTIVIVNCTKAEEKKRKENDERFLRKKKSP
jgi:hypothetical protein